MEPAARSPANSDVTPVLQAGVLVMIAGYADAIGFLQYDAFAGQMTGNTILLAISIFHQSWADTGYYVAVIVSFLFGVLLAGGLVRFGHAPALPLSIAAVAVAICAFIEARWGASLLALAMGLQNAAATRFGDEKLNTVFITGDLQRLFEAIIARLWPKPEAPPPVVRSLALVWFEYFGGALIGVLAHITVPHALLIPAAILPFILFGSWRSGRATSAQ